MRDFEPGTTLMVVANIKYDEADYIRDRSEFEQVSKGWKNLGGSFAQCAGVLAEGFFTTALLEEYREAPRVNHG